MSEILETSPMTVITQAVDPNAQQSELTFNDPGFYQKLPVSHGSFSFR